MNSLSAKKEKKRHKTKIPYIAIDPAAMALPDQYDLYLQEILKTL